MATSTQQSHRAMTVQQAVEEAHRCLLCHDAPCSKGCPGGTDPGKFIRQIRFYNFKGAARTVLGNNPLGGACAYVCPTGETCQAGCVREGLDRPIDIDGLQAFAVEYGRQHGLSVLERGEQLEQKVAVVGGGPAGITAAARLAQQGYAVTLFEARDKLGGMLRYGVPASRLDDAKLDADLAEIAALGVEVKTGTRIDRDNGAQALLDEGYAAVFVAPGLWKGFGLDLPGKDLDGVTTAVDFLDVARSNRAQAESLVKDQNVCVVGGGSVAMDVCSTAHMLGARRIYAVALEGMNELPAQPEELTEALAQGVLFRTMCQLEAITGAGKIAGVEGHEIEWIEPGKPVPSNARSIDGTQFKIKVDTVIQAIGQAPSDSAGTIVTAAEKQGKLLKADADTQATSVAKVFAGGDFVRGASTVVAAVGDGKRAAAAIHKLLSGKEVAS